MIFSPDGMHFVSSNRKTYNTIFKGVLKVKKFYVYFFWKYMSDKIS